VFSSCRWFGFFPCFCFVFCFLFFLSSCFLVLCGCAFLVFFISVCCGFGWGWCCCFLCFPVVFFLWMSCAVEFCCFGCWSVVLRLCCFVLGRYDQAQNHGRRTTDQQPKQQNSTA